MFSLSSRGDYHKTESWLKRLATQQLFNKLDSYGKRGVQALAAATPVNSGLTAASWGYKIEKTRDHVSITWTNSNNPNDFPVAVMLQYGHGTGTGGYVRGIDYINPVVKPIFEQIANELTKAVKS